MRDLMCETMLFYECFGHSTNIFKIVISVKSYVFMFFSAWFREFVVLRMRSDVQNSLILLVFRIVHQKFGNHNFLKIQCFVFSF